jgi:integrase
MSVRKRIWGANKDKEAWIVDYVDQLGERHLQTFEKKKDADAYHDTVRADVRRGVHVPPSKSPTVAEAADRWLAEVNGRGRERTTRKQYEEHIRLHIVPLIGHHRLASLTPDSVKVFRDRLLAKLSRALARKVFSSFKSLLAVSNHSHVVAGVSIGSDKRKRRLEPGCDIPTPQEVTRLLNAAKDDPRRRAFLLVACFTGLRASELRGLRWSDIDLKACELHVRQRADAYNKIGVPKSASSVRTVPIDRETMVPALMAWKIKCPPSEFVFPTGAGKVERLPGFLRNNLLPVMLAAGVTKVGRDGVPMHKYALHSFRHFFASWCINPRARGGRELPPKQVQYLLGHSSISMTFDVYGHLFPAEGNREELASSIRRLISSQ